MTSHDSKEEAVALNKYIMYHSSRAEATCLFPVCRPRVYPTGCMHPTRPEHGVVTFVPLPKPTSAARHVRSRTCVQLSRCYRCNGTKPACCMLTKTLTSSKPTINAFGT